VSDAYDTFLALRDLGFVVDNMLNGSLEEMQDSLARFKNNLATSKNSYGFFFFAGQGVQFNGENYLIPMNVQITEESQLPDNAVSLQSILNDLNDVKNSLNVVVLDACREHAFSWNRSGEQGLAAVGNQPENSIIMYAADAGQTAANGEGRNSMFTQ
jgi:uncharacterized caspase-like protein